MTKNEDVVAPIVHLNGTHANELIELRWGVINALEEAVEALKRACPNERDYYPVEGLYRKAMSQYALRKAMLETIVDGLHEEISKIGRQTDPWRDCMR
jgi:hypothetical protein